MLAAWSAMPNTNTAGLVGLGALVAFLITVYRDWQSDKRATAVERVLREARVPLHRTLITNALAELGRKGDSLGDVSAALAYLHLNTRMDARPRIPPRAAGHDAP